MNSDQKIERILEVCGREDILLADGFEEALIGTCSRAGGMGPVALYSADKCIEILMTRDGMSYEGAVEFFEFNVVSAWVGDETPVFANLLTDVNGEVICLTGVQTYSASQD